MSIIVSYERPRLPASMVHQPAATKAKRRPSPAQRGYGAAHRKKRGELLARSPWCVNCLKRGIKTPATVRDHVVPKRYGGGEDESNEQSLCRPCHDSYKRRLEAKRRKRLTQAG